MIWDDLFKNCENFICKIGILFGLFIVVFIGISIMMTIYTYINMRIRTGNFIEGFENKERGKEEIFTNVMNILKEKNCLSKKNDHMLDLDKYNIESDDINDCPVVNSQTPFVGILQTNYNCDDKINIYT